MSEARGSWRTTLSGVVAGIAFSIPSVLTFYVLGVLRGIWFHPAIQGPKVIAVVQTLEPPPVMQTAPCIVFAGRSVLLIGWASLFRRISVRLPPGEWTRLGRLTLLIWFFSLFFFEFQGLYDRLAEPIPLHAIELPFLATCALGASAVVVAMIGRSPAATGDDLATAPIDKRTAKVSARRPRVRASLARRRRSGTS